MTQRNLLIVNAVVGLVGGAALVLSPTAVAATLGLALGDGGAIVARLYGAELLGFNVAGWVLKDGGPAARRGIILGHVVNETGTAVVLGIAVAAGLGNLLVVGLLVVVALLAIAFIAAALGWGFGNG